MRLILSFKAMWLHVKCIVLRERSINKFLITKANVYPKNKRKEMKVHLQSTGNYGLLSRRDYLLRKEQTN